MKIFIFPAVLLLLLGSLPVAAQNNTVKTNHSFMIRHTVVFRLKHAIGSPEEKVLLDAAKKLSSIPGVYHFECLRQTSKKNKFTFGISMEFETIKAYEGYSNHPDHIAFVQNFWIKEVEDYLEIDYEPFK